MESPALPRPEQRMPFALREVDDVLDHEEVRGEAELLDDGELVLEAADRLGRHRPVALLQSAPCQLREHGVGGLPDRHLDVREVELPETEVQVASSGDLERGVAGAGILSEQPPHLPGALEVQLGVGTLERARQRLTRADRRQHVMQRRILPAHVVHVVGRHDRQVERGRQVRERTHVPWRLRRHRMSEFHVEVAGSEAARETHRGGLRAPGETGEHGAADLAVPATRQRDQTLAHAAEVLQRDHRPGPPEVVLGVAGPQMGGRQQPAQVAVAGHVLAQERQMEPRRPRAPEPDRPRLGEPLVRRQVRLARPGRRPPRRPPRPRRSVSRPPSAPCGRSGWRRTGPDGR